VARRIVAPLRLAAAVALLSSALTACGGEATDASAPPSEGPPTATSGPGEGSPSPGGDGDRRSTVESLPDGTTMGTGEPVTLARYFDQVPSASPVELGGVRERTATRTSYDVGFRSDGLRISGVLDVPTGEGPFPVVVLAHGWIDRESYEPGQGMTRERAALADRGYLALHVDFRNHAGSDDEPELVDDLYLGCAVDTLGAVRALRASDLPVDGDRVALMGRSMGGMVVLQALEMAPGFVDAGIIYSGQSSLEADNYARWGAPGFDYAQDFVDAHGTPDESPRRWRAMSTRPHVDRVTEPVLMIHGRQDDQCPPAWASATRDALAGAGADVRLSWYDDGHAFGPEFDASMSEVVDFLGARVR
jgi:dipeptidyl aminopeptidase/acylaminoacyl peptidase